MTSHSSLPWPYPIRYGQQDSYDTDVLILGGGIAGDPQGQQATAFLVRPHRPVGLDN